MQGSEVSLFTAPQMPQTAPQAQSAPPLHKGARSHRRAQPSPAARWPWARARSLAHRVSARRGLPASACALARSGCLSLARTGMRRPAFASLGPVCFRSRRHRVSVLPRLRSDTPSPRFACRARAHSAQPRPTLARATPQYWNRRSPALDVALCLPVCHSQSAR